MIPVAVLILLLSDFFSVISLPSSGCIQKEKEYTKDVRFVCRFRISQ
jgi:hypothetical protein